MMNLTWQGHSVAVLPYTVDSPPFIGAHGIDLDAAVDHVASLSLLWALTLLSLVLIESI